MTEAPEWQIAKLALTLLAIDPSGLCGIWLRARTGPVRKTFISNLPDFFPDQQIRKLHPATSDDLLFGGLDLTATLDSGKAVMARGLLTEEGTVLLLSMAERTTPDLAAKLANVLDNAGHSLIALDEGTEDEELPTLLQDRLAFHLNFDALSHRDCGGVMCDIDRIRTAKQTLKRVRLPEEFVEQVVEIAIHFGIGGPRAPLFVMRCARALTALAGEVDVGQTHLTQALQLIYGPRATVIPEVDNTPQEQPDQPDTPPENNAEQKQREQTPTDISVEAIMATLPRDILERLARRQSARAASGNGSGDARKGNRRGRPKPSQPGRLNSGARVDLIATLRAAAPWQKMRKDAKFARDVAVHIRSSDIRLKRYEELSDRLLIFTVDASGSSAVSRLAEAKGAVELLLSEAYSRRDHVALIAFRGTEAEILLPPTRSLVQTKRRLSAMLGGGGTPLANGLKQALTLAESTASKGLTPTIALLTDGRGNIGLDGTGSRIQAAQDADTIARLIRARRISSLVVDTSARPHKALASLAAKLDAPYLPLPRADARKVSTAIGAALQ